MIREPTFFFGGFPKCGTTALDLQLRQHPDIVMSEPKEPNIYGDRFGDDAFLESCFAHGEGSVRGDATTYYFGMEYVAERIRARQPDARFVVCVRDPIARTVSHYDDTVHRGRETRTFAYAIRSGSRHELLRLSMYHSCIRPFWDAFGPDRFMFVHIEDVGAQETMDRICAFLGVPTFEFTPVVANVGRRRRSETLNKALAAFRSVGVPRVLPKPVKEALRPAIVKTHGRGRTRGATHATEADRALLRELFLPEMQAFRQLTGVSFPGW